VGFDATGFQWYNAAEYLGSAKHFNFFYLYNGPGTASGLIPQAGNPTDITDETKSVEADVKHPCIECRGL
jgi:hypothetical protein